MDKILITSESVSVVDTDTSEIKFYVTGKRLPENPFKSTEKSITEADQSFTIPQLLQRFANGQSLCVSQHTDYDDDEQTPEELLEETPVILDDDLTDRLTVEAELEARQARLEAARQTQISEAQAAKVAAEKAALDAQNAANKTV